MEHELQSKHHEKKTLRKEIKNIFNLRKRHGLKKLYKTKPSKNATYKLSSYDLTDEEIQVLLHDLDQHIPSTPTLNIFVKIF